MGKCGAGGADMELITKADNLIKLKALLKNTC